MSPSVADTRKSSFPARVLQGARTAWFCVAAFGQLAFIAFIVAFYGVRTLTGNFAGWDDKPLIEGYVAGDDIGNLFFAIHVLVAAVVTLAGLMQLIPSLRQSHPRLHRWTGRVFLVLALLDAVSGVWLVVVRGTYLSEISAVAILLDAVLIIAFGWIAWRNARRRRFDVHRRWAMRTFMVVSGVWFLRVGIMGWVLINQGPVGMTDHMSGPADVVLTFGSYLIPLAVLELYFAATRSRRALAKLAMSLILAVATVFTAIGVFGTIAIMWGPYVV